MLFVNEGFTFRNFLVDAITIFVFVVTIWLLITVFMDLFRRHDISGWGKAFWVIGLIILPLLSVLAYLITQGHGMAERNTQQAQQARDAQGDRNPQRATAENLDRQVVAQGDPGGRSGKGA